MLKEIIKGGRQKLWCLHRDFIREKHELKYLFWECTINCNFKCKHCGSNAGGEHIPEVISTEIIKNAFLNVSKNFDANKITIAVTGGEPLLRTDLFEVMEYASSLGFKWGMVTNGFIVDEATVIKAKKAKMRTVDISVDGLNEIHDNFRNQQGAYAKAINAFKLFEKENFLKPLRFTTTVHKDNLYQLEEMFDTFKKLGLKDWRIISVDPIGRANTTDILLSKDDLTKLVAFIKEKRNTNPEMNITYGCAHYLGDEYEDEVRNNFFYCPTGISIASVLHNGDIFVCPNVPREKHLIQGNIKRDSFSKIWNNKFDIFRDKNRTACNKCKKCSHWEKCLGDSFHSWDFKNNKPKVCFIDND